MYKIIVISLLVLLSSCANENISVKALDSILNGTGVKEVGESIIEGSTAKQIGLYKMWIEYFKNTKEMYVMSGITTKYELQEVSPGVKMPVMTNQTIRSQPVLPLPPKKVDNHPFWGVMEKWGMYGMVGFLGHEVGGVLKAGYDAAQGTTYNGDYAEYFSRNSGDITTGNDYTFNPTWLINASTIGNMQ